MSDYLTDEQILADSIQTYYAAYPHYQGPHFSVSCGAFRGEHGVMSYRLRGLSLGYYLELEAKVASISQRPWPKRGTIGQISEALELVACSQRKVNILHQRIHDVLAEKELKYAQRRKAHLDGRGAQ